eukprot:CAMPEP_0204191792 /NCGR_PEP_ID=MMETSP0361-20130328/60361_1 /ASSEMBLY_ACC=CAM_ASM_000343 /TAXON_ID=268821 /ORGANISM="Scrippsiella Hangoei, Strain SHTV-5" /LENGTH=35 /DNA_ID= /DNA_START= /DNA_END= /DNA_ORIENTATION=
MTQALCTLQPSVLDCGDHRGLSSSSATLFGCLVST